MAFDSDRIVETQYGRVAGIEDDLDTWSWRGIPFAAAPVGELRWKAPRPPAAWDDVRDASRYGPLAPQALSERERGAASEDCLHLNVWRPRSDARDLPVYFWIHGGGNVVAVPRPYQTPGSAIASRSNVVFVSIHYRLGELGFTTHPSLRTGRPEDALDDSGNYATLDIIAALRFVRDNIEAFGGDPDRVFVTGESAGAYNTLCMLISPAAQGLFHRAMAQSGRQDTCSIEDGDARTDQLLRQLLLDAGSAADADAARRELERWSREETAAYLRSRSFADLLRARRRVPVRAGFRDGAVLSRDGFGALASGTYPNKVPVIVGMNREEAKFQLSRSGAWEQLGPEGYAALAKYQSDLKKATGADSILRALAGNTDQPAVYSYTLSWGAPDAEGRSAAPPEIAARIGACHGIDIPFFFGNQSPRRNAAGMGFVSSGFTPENQDGREELCSAMMRYAASFAHTGDPNAPGSELPQWLPWSNAPDGPKALVFDADAKRAKIAMSREELTREGVEKAKDALPPSLRDQVDGARRFATSRLRGGDG